MPSGRINGSELLNGADTRQVNGLTQSVTRFNKAAEDAEEQAAPLRRAAALY